VKIKRAFFALGFSFLLLAFPAAGAHLTALAEPQMMGMESAGGNVFFDPDLSPELRSSIPALVERAKARVSDFYGPLAAKPNLVFCASTDCFRRFGGIGLGFTDGNHVVISPRGVCEAIISHELAHVELAFRLGGFARTLEKVPQWFDEGQAVMVSGAEEFSEDAWLAATRDGRDAPDLASLESVQEWNRLTGYRGEYMQHTYGTAKREVVRWLAKSGRAGFAELMSALARGELFYPAYQRIESQSAVLAARN
jgi:hypothetical protein